MEVDRLFHFVAGIRKKIYDILSTGDPGRYGFLFDCVCGNFHSIASSYFYALPSDR